MAKENLEIATEEEKETVEKALKAAEVEQKTAEKKRVVAEKHAAEHARISAEKELKAAEKMATIGRKPIAKKHPTATGAALEPLKPDSDAEKNDSQEEEHSDIVDMVSDEDE